MGKKAQLKKQRRSQRLTILRTYQKVAGAVFSAHFRPDCCLNATRVAIEALGRFDITVRPVTTGVMVFNRQMWERVEALGRMPSKSEVDQWISEDDSCWSLGVNGQDTEGPGWPWHLVGTALGHLIDSSAGQMSRPHKAIFMPDVLLLRHGANFNMGTKPLVATDHRGTVLSYMAMPANQEFYHIDGFQSSPHNLKVAAKVVHEMKTVLEEANVKAGFGVDQRQARHGEPTSTWHPCD